MLAAPRGIFKVLVLPNTAFANTVGDSPVMDYSKKQNSWEVNAFSDNEL